MTDKKSCENCQSEDCSAKLKKPEENDAEFKERQDLAKRLCQIKHKIMVLSGKGGVGKSTVAVNLAMALSLEGYRVGLMDVDLHGPSIPKLLGLEGAAIMGGEEGLVPIQLSENFKTMSIGYLLRGADDAVIWRGPLKMGLIKQFIKDVHWGELEFLIIDSPPGTGDEPLSVAQLIEHLDGAIIVTTPQELSIIDVQRSIGFCRKLNIPILGVIENMSGFVCPHCGKRTDIFKSGGGERMAKDTGAVFLGKIPLEPKIVEASDSGKPFLAHFAKTETAKAFKTALGPILEIFALKKNSKKKGAGK